MEDCFVCRMQRGEVALAGGPVYEDELVFAAHVWESPDGVPDRVFLGHMLVETRRHAPHLEDLTDEEAARVGQVVARLARALRAEGAEHVYVDVVGHDTPHLHVHVTARWPATPREFWWPRMDEWPGGLGAHDDAAALSARIRSRLS